MTTCEKCGEEVQVGDWPYCPHGALREGQGGFGPMEAYVDADILDRKDPRVANYGYRTAEGRPGLLIETRSDRRKLMRELGLQYGSNHPGGREV